MRNLVEKQLSWLALLVTAFYSLLGSCRSADASQECGQAGLTKCVRPLERMNSNDLSFARSKMYLRQMCPELENSMKCVQTFTLDCLQENQREHFSNLYADTNKMIMELCHDGPFQDEFLKHAQCMQNDSPRHNLCNKKYERITQEIERRNATIVDGSWNHYICCGFREYLDCSQHSVRRQCGDEAAQFTKQLHARMSSSMLRMYCESYTDETCAIGSGASISRVVAMVPVALVLLARYFT